MNDGIYRDPLHALRAMYDERRVEIAEREARMTEALWAALPSELQERLTALRDASVPHDDSFEELTRAEAAIGAYRTALDGALAMVPSLEVQLSTLPAEVPEPALTDPGAFAGFTRSGFYGVTVASLVRDVERTLAALSPVVTVDEHVIRARFALEGDPFALACAIESERSEVFHALSTSVPRGAHPMRVRPETWGDGIAKALRLRRDAVTGDDAFDGLFLVDAPTDVAARVLGRRARAALVELAYFDGPVLAIGGGVATVRWRFEPDPRAYDAAMRVLACVRRAPVVLRLLSDERRSRPPAA